MVWPECLLHYRQRAAVEGLGLVEAARIFIEHTEVVEHQRDVEVVWSQRVFGEGQRALEEPFGLVVVPEMAKEPGETTQGLHAQPVHVLVARRQRVHDADGPAVVLFGLLVGALIFEDAREVEQDVGDVGMIGAGGVLHERERLPGQGGRLFEVTLLAGRHRVLMQKAGFVKGRVVYRGW